MTFDKVKEIIVDTINCDEDAVTMTARLKEDLEIDSLDAVEMNMALEEAFEITIDDEALMGFVQVKDIVAYIDERIA